MAAETSQAQDPNFSQFFVSPLTLNPALTGKFDGILRIAGNYRNQWPSINNAFITATASADGKLIPDKIAEADTWGIGVMGMTDRTADGVLTSNYISFTTAYHKGLDSDGLHHLGLGFQATYASKKLNGAKLNLGDELDQYGGWTTSTNDPVNNRMLGVNYFDISAGVLYSGSADQYSNYYVGVSVYHINRPKDNFMNGSYALPRRFTFHVGGYIPLADGRVLHLSALHSRQAGAVNTVAGGAVEFNLNHDEITPTGLYLGAWYRWSDAVIPYAGLAFSNCRLGVSYDVNISSLRSASQKRGGMELSLIYNLQKNDKQDIMACPKF